MLTWTDLIIEVFIYTSGKDMRIHTILYRCEALTVWIVCLADIRMYSRELHAVFNAPNKKVKQVTHYIQVTEQ